MCVSVLIQINGWTQNIYRIGKYVIIGEASEFSFLKNFFKEKLLYISIPLILSIDVIGFEVAICRLLLLLIFLEVRVILSPSKKKLDKNVF